MSNPRSTWNTRLGGQNAKRPGAYQAQCKICGRAIFEGQPREWQTKPMGQSHTACVDAENAGTRC